MNASALCGENDTIFDNIILLLHCIVSVCIVLQLLDYVQHEQMLCARMLCAFHCIYQPSFYFGAFLLSKKCTRFNASKDPLSL